MCVCDAAAATVATTAKTLKPRAACCSPFWGKPHGGAARVAVAGTSGRFPQTWKEGAATELKLRSEHRLRAHFNMHHHTHTTDAQPDSSC